MALQPFLWGAGGAQLTPEEIALQRAVLAKKRLAGVDTSPVGSWTQGAARVVDALGDVVQENRLNAATTANKAEDEISFNRLVAALGGGSAPAVGQAAPVPASSAPVVAAAPADVSQNGSTFSPFIDALRGTVTNPYGLAAVASTGRAESGWSPANANRTWSDPSQSGQPGTAGGILSWRGPRLAALQSFAQANGESGNGSPATQAKFFAQESPELIAALNGAKSVEEAQGAINKAWAFAGYNGPSREVARRLGYANAYLPQFQTAQPQPNQGYTDTAVVSQPQAATILPANPAGYAPQDAAPALPPPVTIANAPAVAAVPAAQTQAPSVGRTPASPALIQALKAVNSPYSSEATKGIAKIIIDQYGAQQKLSLADQQRQLEIGRRTAIAQQLGVNPAYAQDDEIWKEGVKNKLAPPSTVTIDNKVYDTRNPGQPLIVGAPQLPTSAQEYEYGQKNPGYVDTQIRLRTASAPKTEGAIPPGYQVNRDANGNAISVTPLPGSPQAMEAAELAKKKDLQEGQKDTATDIVTNAGVQALQAMKSAGLPSTGLIGKGLSMLPSTNAAEVRRNVDVLKSNATVENLNAMRAASPTGGALGSVTEKEGAMLAAKSGILDPDSPNFERDLKDYVKTMLEVVQGREKGRKSFESLKWDAKPSGNRASTGVEWRLD